MAKHFMKKTPEYFFVFDVESVGLHGEGYAVGWIVVRNDWQTMGEGKMACLPGAASGQQIDRDWVSANIPKIEPTHDTPAAVRDAFWSLWMLWKAKGAVLVSDCGWPVEARFLIRCIDDNPLRYWDGPYPLHDLASVFLANREDPLEVRARHNSEHPKHDPLADAKQSARLLMEQLKFTHYAPDGPMPTEAPEVVISADGDLRQRIAAAVSAYIDKLELEDVMNRHAVESLKSDLEFIITKEVK